MNVITGSSAERRVNCPRSWQLEKDIPKQSSDFAKEGIALHQVVAYMIENPKYLHPVGSQFKGTAITQAHFDEKIEPAMEAFACLENHAGGFDYVKVEHKVEYLGAPNYIDVLAKGNDGVLYIIDFKFGTYPVSAVENQQLLLYAAALYDSAVDEYELCIIQPKDEGDALSAWRITAETVISALCDFQYVHKQAQHVDAPMNEGSWCKFCKANLPGVCPKKTNAMTTATNLPALPMEPAAISRYLDMCDTAEQAGKNLRKAAHEMMEKGVPIPGYKIVAKRPTRVYTNVDDAELVLKETLGEEEMYVKKLISPPQAEKKMGKKAYSESLADVVSKVSTGTTMTKESDPRPAVLSFKDVTGIPKAVDFNSISNREI